MSSTARKLFRRRQRDDMRLVQESAPSVGICTPLGDSVHTSFAVSLLQMVMHTLEAGPPGLKVCFHNYASSILPFARNVIAKDALEAGSTHLLWIDSDMEFQPDMLLRLLKHDLPMVGVNATMRRLPHNNCARYADGTELATSIDSTGLEKVDRTGFGVMMVKAEVFNALPMPWFMFEWMPERCVFMGEDYYFLLKAKEAGYEVVVDQDVSKGVRHMGTFGYSPVVKALGESLTEKQHE